MRKHTTILLLALLAGCIHLFGQGTGYPVSEIDSAMLKDASIIIRKFERKIDIHSLNSETVTTHLVLTIMKESELRSGYTSVHYDKWSDVERLEGAIYDAGGKLIRKLGKKDISDESAIEDGLLYSDNRVKSIRPMVGTFPFTVEYFIEQSFRRMLLYPAWSPQNSFNISVELARLEIVCDKGLFPRYKAMRLPSNTRITGDGIKGQSWELVNLPAITREPLCPPVEEMVPALYLTPDKYSVKGFSGDFSTWRSFGEWIAALNDSRDTLDAAIYEKVREITKGTTSKKEKIKRIYRFMQSTCRYVAVAEGLGGIQPEKAENIARLGYGDCKGLVNYTKALLEAAAIPSFYTLVEAGANANPILEDFPGNQFNHVILCVPVERDTIWLECTNMKMPFGFLGDFTENRAVLLVTPQGGILTRTPHYNKEQNTCVRTTRLTIDSEGNASVQIHGIYKGLQFDDQMGLAHLDPDRQKDAVRNRYDAAGMTINSVSFTSSGDEDPLLEENVNATIRKFTSVSGGRMFLSLNRFLDNPGVLPKSESRKFDVVKKMAYIDTDTVILEIPEGYRIESLPGKMELRTQFGLLRSEVKPEGNSIILVRHYEQESGRYPAASYNDFVEFSRQVSKQDKSKAVIRK